LQLLSKPDPFGSLEALALPTDDQIRLEQKVLNTDIFTASSENCFICLKQFLTRVKQFFIEVGRTIFYKNKTLLYTTETLFYMSKTIFYMHEQNSVLHNQNGILHDQIFTRTS
jgi:hypothetical protein